MEEEKGLNIIMLCTAACTAKCMHGRAAAAALEDRGLRPPRRIAMAPAMAADKTLRLQKRRRLLPRRGGLALPRALR